MHNTLRLLQSTALLQPMPRLHAIPDMAGPAIASAPDPPSCAQRSGRASLAADEKGNPVTEGEGNGEICTTSYGVPAPCFLPNPARKPPPPPTNAARGPP